MRDSNEPCPEGDKHDWQRHPQPRPVMRACGWVCSKCGDAALFLRFEDDEADKT